MKAGGPGASKKGIDPIARFMQDHDVALQQLSLLSKTARSVEEHGLTPESRARITHALEFIEDEVSVHNRSEEEALFPVLERYVVGPTTVMRADHVTLAAEFRKLRRAATTLFRHPKGKVAASGFATTARRVIQIFVNHIHKENHILFPLVQKFLTKDALREVARRLV